MMITTEAVYNVVILHHYFYNYLFRLPCNWNSVGTFLSTQLLIV